MRKLGSFGIALLLVGAAGVATAAAQPSGAVPRDIRRLVRDLRKVPFAIPEFEPGAGDPAVQLVLPFGPAGAVRGSPQGFPIDRGALLEDRDLATARRNPPYAWVVMTPGPAGTRSYWVPVDDPRDVLHEFQGPNGKLRGVKRKRPGGVVAVRLPFVPGSTVRLVRADGIYPQGWGGEAVKLPATTPTTRFTLARGGGP